MKYKRLPEYLDDNWATAQISPALNEKRIRMGLMSVNGGIVVKTSLTGSTGDYPANSDYAEYLDWS